MKPIRLHTIILLLGFTLLPLHTATGFEDENPLFFQTWDEFTFNECISCLGTGKGDENSRLRVLERLYSKIHYLSPLEKQLLWDEAFRIARSEKEPPALRAGALHTLAGLTLLMKEQESLMPLQAFEAKRLVLELAQDGECDPFLRAEALGALGFMKIEEASPYLKQALWDPTIYNHPEWGRMAALSLMRLEGKGALESLRLVLLNTQCDSVFHTVSYCMGHIGTPGAVASLMAASHRFMESGSIGFAFARMERPILEILNQREHPLLIPAIQATRFLWRKSQRARYESLLEKLILTAPSAVQRAALRRWIDMARGLSFKEEKRALEKLLPKLKGSLPLEDHVRAMEKRCSATLLRVQKKTAPPSTSFYAVPKYGNTEAQEYGDAVYRILQTSGVPNYNHTGVFFGLDSADNAKVIHAPGLFQTTEETDFWDEYKSFGPDYYGAYTLRNKILDFTDRRQICETAWEVGAASVPYTLLHALDWKGTAFDGTVEDIDKIRCDGVVEYCYEKNGYRVWWNMTHPSTEWNIAAWPDVQWHNEWPDFTIEPERELSPWAQRGTPSHTGPDYNHSIPNNSKLTRCAFIRLPTYEVTQEPGSGFVDVTVTAFDDSGVHKILAILPGGGNPLISVNVQHPLVNSYSVTHRVYEEGLFQYKAMDNGGNEPLAYDAVYIEIPP